MNNKKKTIISIVKFILSKVFNQLTEKIMKKFNMLKFITMLVFCFVLSLLLSITGMYFIWCLLISVGVWKFFENKIIDFVKKYLDKYL